MAFLIPFIQPAATALATYFGVTGTATAVTTTLTTSVAPSLTLVATKVAQSAALYIGSKALSWSCEDSVIFLKQYCENHTLTDVACIAMEAKKATSCVGSWILTGGIVYDGIDLMSKMKGNGQ